ncbi:MAG TPA: DUF3105 domain-containing protein, partial [Acidimicrobiia bacterium]|nr:DUF3105 domain-containing protein [Acidimicrobiia bacterium]
ETRTARLEAAHAARRRTEVLRRRGMIAGAVLIAVALLALVAANRASEREEEDRLAQLVTAGDCTLDSKTDGGSEHVPSPSFDLNPPAGGDHTPQAASEGVYEVGSVPPDGPLVHALEHGFIVLWYRAGADQADVDALEAIYEDHSNAVLVAPRQDLPTPIAATSWHKRLLCPSVDDQALREFVKGYQDKGPEKGFIT